MAVCVLLASCDGSTPSHPSEPVSPGIWGGDHIAMTVTSQGAHLEFDCAHADIPGPLIVDSDGRFSVNGTYVRERGGPVRVGDPVEAYRASFNGTVTERRMSLDIRLPDTSESIGPFTLAFADAGRVIKCL